MDWTTVVVGLAANSVAIAAIVYGYKQQRASLDQQRMLADLANVRTVIDETASHLHVVATVLDNVRLRLTTMGMGFFESTDGAVHPEGTELLSALGRAGDELDVLCARLAIRLGNEHAAMVELTAVDEAVLAVWRALDGIRFNADRQADPGHGQRWVQEYFDERRSKITEQRTVFDAAWKAFVVAAHHAAGAHLPAAVTRADN